MSKIRVYILSITAKFILSKYIIEYNPNNDRLLTNTNQFACHPPIVFDLTAFCTTRSSIVTVLQQLYGHFLS